ncbi:MAG: UbiA-like polyprenyltransferase [Chthoniobacterales bacterium]
MSAVNAIVRFSHFIRFSHTIFALPFALGSMLVAAWGLPTWRIFGLILLCMLFARTAAMLFNRIVDWECDINNPRTANRHRLISKSAAILLCVISSLLFLACAAIINPLCALLSPVALAIILFYSLTKRFTHFAQFFLGIALSIAPVGAWIAVRGSLDFLPLILALGVLLWVAGFDTIYATQDAEFDKKTNLQSLVIWLGIPKSLQFALVLHFLAFLCFILFGYISHLGLPYYMGLAVMLISFVYEHRVARQGNVEAINKAFFTSNAIVSFVFVIAVALSVLSGR